VAAQHRARAVIFRDQRVAVVEEPRDRAARRGELVEPAERVVGERDPGRGGDEPVLDVVDVGPAAIRNEVAVGVVAERCPARRAVLVEAVGRIGAADRIMAGPGVGIVAAGERGELAGRIVRQACQRSRRVRGAEAVAPV